MAIRCSPTGEEGERRGGGMEDRKEVGSGDANVPEYFWSFGKSFVIFINVIF